jgi:hypothetical protein
MSGARSFTPPVFQAAIPLAANVGCWFSVSFATAVLIGLSVFNSLHGPAYDCVRAGAYLLRSRRGPIVPMVQVERSAERAAGVVHTIPLLAIPIQEDIYVRD